jgi:hypothetical protein
MADVPYSDKVLRQVLIDLAETPDVAVFTHRPADIGKRLPAHVVAAAPAPLTANLKRVKDTRFAARPMIVVRSYAADRADAGALAMEARRSLHTAWLKPHTTADGSINRLDVLQEPAEEESEEGLPDGVHVFSASYACIIRPARG